MNLYMKMKNATEKSTFAVIIHAGISFRLGAFGCPSSAALAENLSAFIYDILQRGFTHAHLEKVRIEETMMNSFEYAGANEIPK